MEEHRATAAEKGTVIHRMLMLMPLAPLRGLHGEALKAELQSRLHDMQGRGVITRQELSLISADALAAYYESPLGQRVLAAETVKREWHFDLLVEQTILQGVIDCAFLENGAWVLVDYKTDHFTDDAAFTGHHRPQLAWYAKAVLQLTGTPVSEQYLYAISYGKTYRL